MSAPIVSLTLPQMVDLALGSPEVGSVNFNILHSLLHVMIKQLELQQCAVEFRGLDSERIQAAIASSATPAVKLSEYRVRDRSRRDKEIAKQPVIVQDAVRDDGLAEGSTRLLKTGAIEERRGSSRTRADLTSSASSSSSDCRTRTARARNGNKGCRRCSGLDDPDEALRHSRRRRFSAHLLEVLTSSSRLERLSEDVASLQSQVEEVRTGEDASSAAPDAKTMAKLTGRAEAIETRIAKLASQGEDAFRRLEVLEDAVLGDAERKALRTRRRSHRRSAAIAQDGANTSACEATGKEVPANLPDGESAATAAVTHAREDRGGATASLASLEEDVLQQGRSLGDLQADLRLLSARLDGLDGLAQGLGRGLSQGLGAAERRAAAMQADVDSLATHLGTLFREREQRTAVLQGLQSQVQALEKQKADRWLLESALADKADRGLVSAKVSHTEFNAACTNIHNDLGEARTKLNETESRLDAKLDRAELPAVAAELAERVERLVAERPSELVGHMAGQHPAAALLGPTEHFAAGTKIKLLRNVNCISCDGRVAMRCDDWCPAVPACDSFPDRRPTRPFLACQAFQRCAAGEGPSFGTVCSERTTPERHAERHAERPGERLVTRFCGGSHTVTTVGARVAHRVHAVTSTTTTAATTANTAASTPTAAAPPSVPVAMPVQAVLTPCH